MDIVGSTVSNIFTEQFARKNPVVFILHNFDCSGANMSVFNVLQGFLERGFKIVVLSRKNGVFATRFAGKGIIVRIGESLSTLIDEYLHTALCFICNTIMTCTEITYIRSRSPTKCSIWWLHEWWDRDMLGEQLQIRGIDDLTVDTVVRTFSASSTVVFVCQAQKKFYLDCPLYNIADSCRAKVIYVGSTTSMNGLTKPRMAERERPFIFLSLGIVCPRKNQVWAVKLFKKFVRDFKPNAKLIIVGAREIRQYEKDYLDLLRAEVADDPHIEVHGVIDDPDSFYKMADCLLFTSSNEVTPLVISEAMAWGLPILSTSIGGIPEMIDDSKEGFLFPLHDDDKAVSCMRRVYCERDLCATMSSNGNDRYSRQFDMALCVRAWVNLVHSLCPPTVLVDMDGTLVDWDGNFKAEWAVAKGGAIDRGKSYHMEECVPAGDRRRAEDLFLSEGFFASLQPVEGALQAVREMGEEGIRVVLCTSLLPKSRHCAQEKVEWVRKWLGEEFVARTVVASDKSMVRGDVLIDDRPMPADLVDRATWTHVVFSQPYNTTEAAGRRPRLSDWNGWREVVLPLLGMEGRAATGQAGSVSLCSGREAPPCRSRHSDSYESFDRFIKPNSPLHKIALHKYKRPELAKK